VRILIAYFRLYGKSIDIVVRDTQLSYITNQ